MNRETESHFSLAPTIEAPRSIFDRSNQIKTSFNAGDLVPIEVWNDVMPGDTIQMNIAEIIRMTSALKTPVMDNAYLDIYFFFVPNRLVNSNWEKFMGENDNPWAQTTAYTIPKINAPSSTGWKTGTIADYMGIPTKVAGIAVDRQPFNAYCKIYNDYFRDENVNYALSFDKSTYASNLTGSNGTTPVTDCALGGMPAKVNKFHDYFTSALPSPLKNASAGVSLPLGKTAPVGMDTSGNYPLTLSTNPDITNPKGIGSTTNINATYEVLIKNGLNPGLGTIMYADLQQATAATIGQLYQAMALQRMYNLDALGGTRYNELIYSHFGVKSPDARLQRSEYLGGKRIALNKEQVEANTSASGQYLGSLGAYSLTGDKENIFTYSAQEFGILLCLASVRCEHSYQQGLNKEWTRTTREDLYFPALANISEQPIYNYEIYAQGTSTDNQVFGYQEAWASYRYKPSRVTGQMRSNATGTLDTWHYADNYASLPTLSPTWMAEPTTNLDRTLAVTSSTANQIIMDIYFDTKWTREMPMYSIPGIPAM